MICCHLPSRYPYRKLLNAVAQIRCATVQTAPQPAADERGRGDASGTSRAGSAAADPRTEIAALRPGDGLASAVSQRSDVVVR